MSHLGVNSRGHLSRPAQLVTFAKGGRSGSMPTVQPSYGVIEGQLPGGGGALACTRGEILRAVMLPLPLPYIAGGLRIAVGRALVGIVGQLLIVATGIGYIFQFYGEALSLAKYFAPLIVVAASAIALNRAVNWAEHVLIPWKPRAFT